MSYLWLRISILHATMQINNQCAVSRAFFLIVSVYAHVCARVPISMFCRSACFLTTETVMFQNKVTVSLPDFLPRLFFMAVKCQTYALTSL